MENLPVERVNVNPALMMRPCNAVRRLSRAVALVEILPISSTYRSHLRGLPDSTYDMPTPSTSRTHRSQPCSLVSFSTTCMQAAEHSRLLPCSSDRAPDLGIAFSPSQGARDPQPVIPADCLLRPQARLQARAQRNYFLLGLRAPPTALDTVVLLSTKPFYFSLGLDLNQLPRLDGGPQLSFQVLRRQNAFSKRGNVTLAHAPKCCPVPS
ncbi:uncharacterized protein SCHCODRAFT_02481979 [Schizophyllum commune H4-8]|nr:uncharacterized protein SCHCODRAFT_02481979 [Schizophyllum commune H4-8]KAI5900338.1 hypothetical protein SCHCODRAFT_02481979 [Schizophyllum commune H4-8]